VPTFHVGGWYDCFLQGTLNHFSGLQTGGGPGALGNQKLMVGAWTHGRVFSRDQGELTYPVNAAYDSLDEMLLDALRWFDYWLLGDDNGIMAEPAVRYYVMGDVDDDNGPGNEWREGETWPPPGHEERLYLWGGGGLRGSIATDAAATPEWFAYDPAAPVPTRGGANLKIDPGPYDQRPVEGREDVLVYTSEQLTEPLEVIGRVWVELHAASSAVDTDWTAKLCDVYPDGRSMLVCDGVLRARCRESCTSPTLLAPGTTYRFMIDLWSTSLVFNTGHRIRLVISSSNATRFEPNRNNGLGPREGVPVVATNTIYHDAERRSALILPVTSPGPGEHPLFAAGSTPAAQWALYE
jgi:putative CocE/NonD family hydrolase